MTVLAGEASFVFNSWIIEEMPKTSAKQLLNNIASSDALASSSS